MLVTTNPHPIRSATVNVLRFASVLIGAGLLLRTASAEHVISAPQEPSAQPDQQAPNRLALPQPAFGQVQPGAQEPASFEKAVTADSSDHRDQSNHRRAAAAPDVAFAPAAAASAPEAALAAAPGKSSKEFAATFGSDAPARVAAVATPMPEARPAASPAPKASTAAPRLAKADKPAADKTAASPPVQNNAAMGLLAPVRIVSSGIAANAPATRAPSSPVSLRPVSAQPVAAGAGLGQAAAPQTGALQSAATQPASPQVQISLAPPVMRPGPRTTQLVSDVRSEMRRPASAWEYAEALPPELRGGRAAPRQAAAQPAAPQIQGPAPALAQAPAQAPNPVQAARPAAAMRPAPAELAAAPARAASPVRQEAAPIAAPPERGSRGQPIAAAAPSAKPDGVPLAMVAPAASEAKGSSAQSAPRVLALLDREPVKAPRKILLRPEDISHPGGSLAVQPVGKGRPAVAAGSRSSPPAIGAPSKRKDDVIGIDASASFQQVSAVGSAPADATMLADASSGSGGDSGISMRDRIPRPAF